MFALVLPPGQLLTVAALIFLIGLYGALTRRNLLTLLMAIELMLNAAALSFVAFSAWLEDLNGQVLVFFILVVAAGEAAVGLGLVMVLQRSRNTTDVDEISALKG